MNDGTNGAEEHIQNLSWEPRGTGAERGFLHDQPEITLFAIVPDDKRIRLSGTFIPDKDEQLLMYSCPEEAKEAAEKYLRVWVERNASLLRS